MFISKHNRIIYSNEGLVCVNVQVLSVESRTCDRAGFALRLTSGEVKWKETEGIPEDARKG